MEKNIKSIDEQTWSRIDALNGIREEIMDMTAIKILLGAFNRKTVDDSKVIDFARNVVYATLRQVVDIIEESIIDLYDSTPIIVNQTESMPDGIRFLARAIISLQQAINFYNNDPRLYLYIRHLIDTRDAFIEELMEQDRVDWVDRSALPDYLEFYTHDEEGETHYYSFHIVSPKSDLEHRRMLCYYGSECKKIVNDIKTNDSKE